MERISPLGIRRKFYQMKVTMRNPNELSPVLPSILTSLFYPETDKVHVIGLYYHEFGSVFARQGIHGNFDRTPAGLIPFDFDDASDTFVSLVPYGVAKDSPSASLIRNALNSSVRKMYLIVFPNLLFSNRLEDRKLRKELLEANLVEASIMLPERMLPDISLGVSLLILNKDRTSDDRQVRFINASSLDTKKVEVLAKAEAFDELREYVRGELSYDRPDCVSVDARDLIVRGESLLASAHCLTDEQKQAQALLAGLQTNKLEKVAHFFRPLLPSKDGKGEKLKVLNVAQFSSYGYTKPECQTEAYVERAGKTDQLIQAGDIVLCIRGTLGKVGIAAQDFTTDDPWVVSPASIILRPVSKDYDPRLLFLYLRSELGQALLKKLATGATVPMVQIKDLKNLDIVIPTEAEAEQLLADFEAEVALSEQIAQLEAQRKELSSRQWAISN